MIIENEVLKKVENTDINPDGSFEIPEGVKVIGESAFEACISLTSLIIPEWVTSIEEWASPWMNRWLAMLAR